jgi:hypothetical protein
MAADIEEKLPQDLLLTRASLHQGPFVSLALVRVISASNEDLCFVQLDHFIVERIRRLHLIRLGVWKCWALETVSSGKKHEVDRFDFERLMEFQSNISHCREGDTNATAEILHELLDLMEISKIGAEVSFGDGIHRSTLCGWETCKK